METTNNDAATPSLRFLVEDFLTGNAILKTPFLDTSGEPFSSIINFYHMVFFGDGKYCWVPFAWCTSIIVASTLILLHEKPFSASQMYLQLIWVYYVEMIANFFFLYMLLKRKAFHKSIEIVHPSLRKIWNQRLVYIWIFSFLFSCAISSARYFPSSPISEPIIIIYDCFEHIGIFWFLTCYLCGTWCWMIIIRLKHFYEDIFPLIQQNRLALFGEKFFEFCENIERESLEWRLNHIVRTITGIYVASVYVALMQYNIEKDTSFCIAGLLLIVLYYGTVWATYFCAGYANDTILMDALKELGRMKIRDDELNQDRRDLLQQIPFAYTGLHVSGIYMSCNLAMALGSTIISVMVAFYKLGAGLKD